MCFLYYIGYAFNFVSYVAVGAEVDNEKMELLLSQLSGKDITELIAAGREKFASVPCGGGGVAVAAAAPAAGGGAPAAEAKKEEKVEEKEESDDVSSFLMSHLFLYLLYSQLDKDFVLVCSLAPNFYYICFSIDYVSTKYPLF
jgi:large subunit ribosomal protein LP2